jgi:hypothetical protein
MQETKRQGNLEAGFRYSSDTGALLGFATGWIDFEGMGYGEWWYDKLAGEGEWMVFRKSKEDISI